MKLKSLILASAMLVGAHTANADVDSLTKVVKYQDLSLEQSGDANKLYDRLERAAKRLCVTSGARDLAARKEFDRCRAAAVVNAVAEINHPNLSQEHLARTGHAVPAVAVAAR